MAVRALLGVGYNAYRKTAFRTRRFVDSLSSPYKGMSSNYSVGNSRESWERCLISLLLPVVRRLNASRTRATPSHPISIFGRNADGHEGFSRSLIGVGYLLSARSSSVVEFDGKRWDIAKMYRVGIINGTTPGRLGYWGHIIDIKRIVESGTTAMALLMAKKHLWNPLTDSQKTNVLDWFRKDVDKSVGMNNWAWYLVFHYLILEELGGEDHHVEIEALLERIELMHVKDGWYSDGLEGVEAKFDYYNPWDFHLYSMLFCMFSRSYAPWKEKYGERTRQFLKDYEHFLTPGNHPVFFGRSQSYRFCSIAPLGPGFLMGHWKPTPWLKSAALSTVNSFLQRGILCGGLLVPGYYGSFPPMLETYIGSYSSYWALKAFSVLMLPDSHAFWRIKSDVEPKRGVYSVSGIHSHLIHDGTSHIIFLNNRAHTIEYPRHYNKFAYSNVFLPNFVGKPVDNMLRVKTEGWAQRGRIEGASFPNHTESVWLPDNGSTDFKVWTALVPRPDGYCAVHRIEGKPPFCFESGGFPIAGPVDKEISGNSVVLRHGEGVSGMEIVYGDLKPKIHRAENANPGHVITYVPYFGGRSKSPSTTLVFCVWANTTGYSMKLPKVRVQDSVELSWERKISVFASH